MGYNVRYKDSNYLCHKSHKYIDKKWSNGRWNYIYEEAKDKLGIGTKDKVSNARDASRRANYEVRKSNEKLETAQLIWDTNNIGNNPDTKAAYYGHSYQALHNAKANADRANHNARAKKEALDKAEKTHENSLANKAEKAVKSVEQTVAKGKEIAQKLIALPFMAAFVAKYTYHKNHDHN